MLGGQVKKLEASLKEKDILLQIVEGSLVEARSQNTKLSEELDEARSILGKSTRRFNHETKELEAKIKAETKRNTKLHEAFENLRNKCADFATRCVNRLKGIFNSVGAASEETTPSAEDIPGAFDHIENEVEALDEVITEHRDFCALVASRGTAVAFI
jgi:chromosome segregation ATPase